jgi:hypothetical protein
MPGGVTPANEVARFPEVARSYELKVWYGLSVGEEVWEKVSSRHTDFRAAVAALAAFIVANGGFNAWFDLNPRDASNAAWVYGAHIGGTVEGGNVDRRFQAGIYELTERLRRAASLRNALPPWLLRLIGTYTDRSPLSINVSIVRNVAQL